MKERGIDLEEIATAPVVPPRVANLLLYLIVLWRPPRWLWDRLLKRVAREHRGAAALPAARHGAAHALPRASVCSGTCA